MRKLLITITLAANCLAQQQNGLTNWWHQDGKIDTQQKQDLDALEDDTELWCALAELWLEQEETLAANCAPTQNSANPPPSKTTLTTGTKLDTNAHLQNYFFQINHQIHKAYAQAKVNQKQTTAKLGYNNNKLHIKAGDLLTNSKGIHASAQIHDLKLGATYLKKQTNQKTKDTAWVSGKYNADFLDKKFYAGVNTTNNWSKTWQGIRLHDWTLQITELAHLKNSTDSISVSTKITRKRKNAAINLEKGKNNAAIAAGLKPGNQTTDSIWAQAQHPLRLRLGWNKKHQQIHLSQSLTVKEKFSEKTPLEYRQESSLKIPLPLEPKITIRHTLKLHPSKKITTTQLYLQTTLTF